MSAGTSLSKSILVISVLVLMGGCGKQVASKVNSSGANTATAASSEALTDTDTQSGLALVQNTLMTGAITEDNLPVILDFLKAADPAFDLNTLLGAQHKDLIDQLNAKLADLNSRASGLALATATTPTSGKKALVSLTITIAKTPAGKPNFCLFCLIGNTAGSIVGGASSVADSVVTGVASGVVTTASAVKAGVAAGATVVVNGAKAGAEEGAVMADNEMTCGDHNLAAVDGVIGSEIGGAVGGVVKSALPAAAIVVQSSVHGVVVGTAQATNTIVKGSLFGLGETFEQVLYGGLYQYVVRHNR